MNSTASHTRAYTITSTVLLSLLMPVIVIGNVLVILAFGTTRRLRTSTNYFVVSLAVADIMVGCLSLPIYTVVVNKDLYWPSRNPRVNQLWTAIDMITAIASIVNLMYISVERYICIQYPYRYQSILTKPKLIGMIVLSWLYGVLNYSLIQFTYEKRSPRPDVTLAITIMAFIIPLIIILVMYGKLGKIALQHKIQIIENHESGQSQKNKRRLLVLVELKATRTLAVVVGAFVLCFVGYFVQLLHTMICKEWSLDCALVPNEVTVGVQWMKYFNSSLNPFIYTIMNSDMRAAMKRLISGKLSPSETPSQLRGNSRKSLTWDKRTPKLINLAEC